MDSDGLERGTGGQGWFWRLTDRDLVGREEGEWGVWGGGISLLFHSIHKLSNDFSVFTI